MFVLAQENHKFLSFPVVHSKREEIEHIYSNSSRSLLLNGDKYPLFQGMGVHYSYIWVGSPPQRVSVILDTGSHHTAFPCVGCSCGKHMDPFFDPSASSTSRIKTCGIANRKCFFSQSYSEGSSWQAYRLNDKVFLGSETLDPTIYTPQYQKENSVDFDFGCQTLETGLFRTQNIDGIMGLSASPETFPYYLYNSNITQNRLFSLCFTTNGGTFTVGGIDHRLHVEKKNNQLVKTEIGYAKLVKNSGWYTVKLLDIKFLTPEEYRDFLGDNNNNNLRRNLGQSIGGNLQRCNEGKGTIVDSGTTDTYLPYQLQKNFAQLFNKLTGIVYRNEAIILSPDQYKSLPNILYEFEGFNNEKTQVVVTPDTYVQKLKNGRYIFRIYLTESIGAVLGSNFIFNHDVIFDIDNLRVGFARSDCKYGVVDSQIIDKNPEPTSSSKGVTLTNVMHTNNTVLDAAWFSNIIKNNHKQNLLPHSFDSYTISKLVENRLNETINNSLLTKFVITPCSAQCPPNSKLFTNIPSDTNLTSIKYLDEEKNLKISNLIQVTGKKVWKITETSIIEVETCNLYCSSNNEINFDKSIISNNWSECNKNTCNRYKMINDDITSIQSELCFSSLLDCTLPNIISSTTKDYLLLTFRSYHVSTYNTESFLSSISDIIQVPRSFIWVQDNTLDSIGSVHDDFYLNMYVLIDSDDYWKQIIHPQFEKLTGKPEKQFIVNKLIIFKYIKDLLSTADLHLVVNSIIGSPDQFLPYSLNIKDFSLVDIKENKVIPFYDPSIEKYQYSAAFSINELQSYIKYTYSPSDSWAIYSIYIIAISFIIFFFIQFKGKKFKG